MVVSCSNWPVEVAAAQTAELAGKCTSDCWKHYIGAHSFLESLRQ